MIRRVLTFVLLGISLSVFGQLYQPLARKPLYEQPTRRSMFDSLAPERYQSYERPEPPQLPEKPARSEYVRARGYASSDKVETGNFSSCWDSADKKIAVGIVHGTHDYRWSYADRKIAVGIVNGTSDYRWSYADKKIAVGIVDSTQDYRWSYANKKIAVALKGSRNKSLVPDDLINILISIEYEPQSASRRAKSQTL